MTCYPNCDHPRVTLVDGTQTCSWSREWLAECEARTVCNFATVLQRRRYLIGIDTKRGPEAGAKLRQLVRQVWKVERPADGGE